MKARLLLLLTLVLALGGALLLGGGRAQQARRFQLPPSGFEVGQVFPTLTLPAAEDGRPRSLADFRGQKLILHIFASW
ncbi:MAG: hypothetical protein ACE5G6_04390 [Terriglobia bacterium]